MAAFLLWYNKMLKTNYVSFVEGIRSIPPLLTEEISYFIKETQNILSLRSFALYFMVIQRSSYDELHFDPNMLFDNATFSRWNDKDRPYCSIFF